MLQARTKQMRTAHGANALMLSAMAALALAGCASSSALTTGSTSPHVFDLKTPQLASADLIEGSPSTRAMQIVVDEPAAVRSMDGETILVAMQSAEITSLADATWSDRLPRLVQARLISALSASRAYKSVGDGRDKASADIVVSSEIRAFQIEAVPGNDNARVAINVRLIKDRTGKVVASRSFTAERAVAEASTKASVAALNAAFADILAEFTSWTAETLDPKRKSTRSRDAGRAPDKRKPPESRPGLVSHNTPRA